MNLKYLSDINDVRRISVDQYAVPGKKPLTTANV
jgi:hypothetical protein